MRGNELNKQYMRRRAIREKKSKNMKRKSQANVEKEIQEIKQKMKTRGEIWKELNKLEWKTQRKVCIISRVRQMIKEIMK